MPRPDRRPAPSPDASGRTRWSDDLAALGVAAAPSQLDALQRFVDLLLRWNNTYNLTALRDPEAVWVQHVLDSLSALPSLARWLAGRAAPAGTQPRLLDVGSGGGLPGAVWAIFLPECEVTCVDAVGKKAAFIRQVASELRLPNLHSRHARVESLDTGPFDIVACRAFASLADFTRWSRHLLAPGGAWLALKGKRPQAEIDALPADIDVFHVEPLHVPHLDAARCLVWMRPEAPSRTVDTRG